jgi:hypothetical protein
MTLSPNQPTPDDGLVVPPKLAADLSALYRVGDVPAGVDVAVVAEASRRMGRQRRRRRWLLVAAGPVAAAAGLAVAVWLYQSPPPHQRLVLPGTVSAGLRGDVDGSGGVDIIDALLLAASLRDGGRLDPLWDLSGDGVVTHADVDSIAAAAVRVAAAGVAPAGGAS